MFLKVSKDLILAFYRPAFFKKDLKKDEEKNCACSNSCKCSCFCKKTSCINCSSHSSSCSECKKNSQNCCKKKENSNVCGCAKCKKMEGQC